MFQLRHINRMKYPQKHVLICEDDLNCQKDILAHFATVFEPQGEVQFSVVAGAVLAASVTQSRKIDLILLDHDMPEGNGTDLLIWMKKTGVDIPVITFSGIPQNNINMMALGANYCFGKGDVIAGKADQLIKKLLRMNSGVAEQYVNKVCINSPTATRYWITPNIMVGGSILDGQDWFHLKNDFGIEAVVNAETEHDDNGKGIERLLQVRVNDDGGAFPNSYIHNLIHFINTVGRDRTFYIHCQQGGSRSPAFAYAVLRGCYGMTPEEALAKINETIPNHNYGHHQYHHNYMKTVEEGLSNLDVIAEYYTNTNSPILPVTTRYWITPNLLLGGDICDQKDWEHLRKDFGVNAVINVNSTTDTDKTIANLLERHVHDNGDPFPVQYVRDVISFAKKHLDHPIYLHCHAGISRSPHFAYAILRGCHNMTQEEAMATIRKKLPDTHHGFNSHTKSYVKSIEDALTNWTP
jgi:predicted protein tyrosine phosphatase/CheY-like chemotaxis protein